jgi:ribosomal protein S27AE
MIHTHGFTQQGWECPKCGKVYSPSTPMCLTCPQKTTTITTTGTQLDGKLNWTWNTDGTTTYLCRMFIPDGLNTSATKCMRCGKEKNDHPQITNL